MAHSKGSFYEVLAEAKRLTYEERRQLMDELSKAGEQPPQQPPIRLGGLWSGLQFSEEEIDQARRELWGDLEREVD